MMDNPQRGRMEDIGRKIDEHIQTTLPQMEAEVRRIIKYLNDEVVPQVRRNSSEALKAAADQLAKLADTLERGKRQQPPTGGKQ
jgi:hypothetical protein